MSLDDYLASRKRRKIAGDAETSIEEKATRAAQPGPSQPASATQNRLLVRNLAPATTESGVRSLFARYGRLTEVRAGRDAVSRTRCNFRRKIERLR